MSRKIKNEQKKFLGETLNQYDKALDEAINQLDKKNREQNHKISSLVNSFDNEYLEKDIEGNMTTLENSKDGMVIINEIQGSTEVNYCKEGEKELILNGDIDTQGESFVTLTEGVDGGLVDVSLEGNTEINLSKTKDPVLVTREFDDINCNVGKLQYTIDNVTTINDEPGKVDIDRIVGDTMVNHAVNGSEELILNAHINESGDNSIKLNGVTSDGGKVDVYLEGNTLVNVSNVKDDYITPTIEDKVDQGSVISLPEVSEGFVHIDEIEGNTMVNYCTDGSKELTLNGDIDTEGTFVTTTEGVDNGLVDVVCEGNTLVNNILNISTNEVIFTPNKRTSVIGKDGLLKDNTDYTVIFKISDINLDGLESVSINLEMLGGFENHGRVIGTVDKNGIYKFKHTTSTRVGNGNIVIKGLKQEWEGSTSTTRTLKISEIMLLEGDWTNREVPEYFEGMKSVGQDDVNGHKIEILSQNKNEIKLVEHTRSFTNRLFGNYNVRLPVMGKTFSYRYDYEIISISEEQDDFITNLAGTHVNSPNIFTDFDLTIVNQRLYNGAKGTVVVNNISNSVAHTLTEIRCIRTSTPVTMTYKITNFALYFSDNADTYIPYAENNKEILLNEPLRGLPNGTKDRFVKIGGKWFIERKCGETLLDGNSQVSLHNNTSETYIRYRVGLPTNAKNSGSSNEVALTEYLADNLVVINSLPPGGVSPSTSSGIYLGSGFVYSLPVCYISIEISKLITPDIEGFKDWLSKNNIKLIYELATPTYEPLEIEPTLNTYNDTTHLSNNSIIPCNMVIKNTGYNAIIKPSTLYTVAVDTNKNGEIGINLAGAKVTTTNNVATITTPETLTDDSLRLYGKGIKGSKVRILEGDKTNWIPSFFEGMKSSFEDKVQEDGSYKMEILMNNKNLVKLKSENVYKLGEGSSYVIHSENSLTLKGTADFSHIRIKVEQKLKPLTKYYISYDITLIKGSRAGVRVIENHPGVADAELYSNSSITTSNKTHIEGTFTTKYISDLALLINSAWEIAEDSELLVENLQISEIEGDYIENKSNKIQLSSIEPLRGVGDVHDRLVFKDGKLMIERNIGEVTIKDNISYVEVVNNSSSSSTNRIYTTRFILGRDMFPNIKLKTDYYFKSDRFKHALWNLDVEGFSIGSNLDFNILNTRLSSLDAEGVIEWFRNNPTKFAYLLAEPTYEEIPSDLQKIILESYNNGTLFFDTNIPPTKVSFNCFEEELTYLYPSTSYTLQFVSDRNTTADISLGGTQLLAQNIVQGLNRITITTPDTLVDNKLIIDGVGASISEVVVTDTDREFGYFEGMKSVGECEGSMIEVLSQSNLANIATSGNTNFRVANVKAGVSYSMKSTRSDNTVGYNLLLYDVDGNELGTVCGGIYSDFCTFTPFKDGVLYLNSYKGGTLISDIMLVEGVYTKDTMPQFKPYAENTQQLTHEPLRGIGNTKDRYVLIDGKWYIERNCMKFTFDGSENYWINTGYGGHETRNTFEISMGTPIRNERRALKSICDKYTIEEIEGMPINDNACRVFNDTTGNLGIYFLFTPSTSIIPYRDTEAWKEWLSVNPITIIVECSPTYEPIGYNPLEVYSDVTHISTNSTIPCNVTVKNHGYNMVALKENTQYTLYVNKNTTNALTYRLGDYVEINSPSKFTFTTPETLTDKTLRIDGKGVKVKDLMLIEGTPTNDSVGYFDGLKSSYECEQVTDENDENYGKYKVDVKVVGKNLFNKDTIIVGKYQNCNTNTGAFEISTHPEYNITDFVPVKPNTQYVISGTGMKYHAYYDKDKNPITTKATLNLSFTTPSNAYYMIFNIKGTDDLNNIQIEEGDIVTEYEPYFESTQTIYLNSPLLKGDEIVWKDNKIQHYHKMNKVVLDGSDDETFGKAYNTNSFYILVNNMIKSNNYINKIYCDKLATTISYNNFVSPDKYGISGYTVLDGYPGENWIYIRVPNIETVAEIKQWLQQNPITVVYELETPYYEEISDYPLKLNVIANSSLSTESTIQVTNIFRFVFYYY